VSPPLSVTLGGYGPRDSTHSAGLRRIAADLHDALGPTVDVRIDYNVLDSGRRAHELLDDVEAGRVTACYFSTTYLVDRVAELGLIDLPYVFDSLGHAHRCLDAELGRFLAGRVSERTGLITLGYWDNGVRHLSNRRREIHRPEDCRGLRVRLQPNWVHEQFFHALGALPVCVDLKEGIELIRRGEVDAQENPLANFVAYGVDRLHPQLTLTGHAYGARGLYASEAQLRAWPPEARRALERAAATAVAEQRAGAAREEARLEAELEGRGTRVVRLNADEMAAFRAAAAPVVARARDRLGAALFRLLEA
jgi:TRAP-type C4-dicarboxylate transport system substrate-binding protein